MPILKVKNNGTWMNIGSNADTLDGKHAEEFAQVVDVEGLKTLVGDIAVSEQIDTAIQKSVADWSQTDTTAVDYIKNKPDIATDEEIVELLMQVDMLPAITDSDGSVLSDEDGNILSW